MKGDNLSPKQELFCREYLKDLNAKAAAIRAGYSKKSSAHTGCMLLQNPGVKRRIQEAMDKRSTKIEITSEEVLAEIAAVAFADINAIYSEDGTILNMNAIPHKTRRAIASIEQTTLFAEGVDIGEKRKVRFWDKIKALELLGRHLTLFQERTKYYINGEPFTGEEILDEYARLISNERAK